MNLGDDADTMAGIAGGVAEPFWRVQSEVRQRVLDLVDEDLRSVATKFNDPPRRHGRLLRLGRRAGSTGT